MGTYAMCEAADVIVLGGEKVSASLAKFALILLAENGSQHGGDIRIATERLARRMQITRRTAQRVLDHLEALDYVRTVTPTLGSRGAIRELGAWYDRKRGELLGKGVTSSRGGRKDYAPKGVTSSPPKPCPVNPPEELAQAPDGKAAAKARTRALRSARRALERVTPPEDLAIRRARRERAQEEGSRSSPRRPRAEKASPRPAARKTAR